MSWIDWAFAVLPVVMVFLVVIYTKQYMRSVADFMSGGRKARRYLLAVAKAEMTAGAVVFVALFEMTAKSGFVLTWWNWINVPISLILGITGFVIYRYRETRAMTLAQFFELRYSKAFRLFTGGLAFFAGIINFGIMPVVGARFFVYFLGMPDSLHVLSFQIPTYIPLMGLFISITLAMTLAGGMVSLIVTNCLEGILSQILYVIIIAALLMIFKWSEIAQVLGNRPPGESLLNPFDAGKIQDFNVWYVLMTVFVGVYGTMAWQNQGAYNSAGITAHETRMGGILGRIRELGKMGVITLLAVCGLTYLEHPDFANGAKEVGVALHQIASPQIQEQMKIPLALAHLLPEGAKGALCAVLLLGLFGGDSNHMHSWGSIFVQDILVPLRKKPFGPKQHIFVLRLAISGVALFAFLFGCVFRQTEYIMMWWQVTTAVFVGGGGAAIIGGLYWKKGTTTGAWAALLTGSILSGGGILARQFYGEAFPLNGMEVSFYATLIAITIYLLVSLLTCRSDYNLERLLHRGEYAKIKAEVQDQEEPEPKPQSKWTWGRLIGFDEHYTRSDRWITGGLFWWSMFWFGTWAVGSVWNIFWPWPLSAWSLYWQISGIGLPLTIAVIMAVWFTWGGVKDMQDFFHRLRTEKINHLDDGTVVGHRNLDEDEVSTHKDVVLK